MDSCSGRDMYSVRHDFVKKKVTTRGRGRGNTVLYLTTSFGDDYIE